MTHLLGRRELLAMMAAQAVTLPEPKTYTYKVAGGCDIKADVYGADSKTRKPVLVWVHGGALIMGSRRTPPAEFANKLLDAGFAVVSIDYRLAPETKLPQIIEDLRDACAWVSRKGPTLFNGDGSRISVSGSSAGGYLTLMSGTHVKPKPKVLVAFWGYSDITGTWYSRPDAFYNKEPAVPKDKAYSAVEKTAISEASDPNDRWSFYLYCRQHGLWPKEVAAHDPDSENAWFNPYCPIRNVTAAYPPTMLVHGTKDTDVPYDQSVQMAAELERKKVKHEFVTVQDGPHGFGGVDPALVTKIYTQAVDFLKSQ